MTDVDDTLFGDDPALASLLHALERVPAARLVLDSSRPVASIRRTLAASRFAIPWAAIVGALGTEFVLAGDAAEPRRLRFEGYDRRPVDRIMAREGFAPHDPEFQTPWKASFAVPAGEPLARARRALAGIDPRMALHHSGGSDLDVIPARASKAHPLADVARALGVPFARMIAAGDAAPDAPMLDAAAYGIVVGNARDELRNHRFATRLQAVRATHAAGIEEGLRRLGLLDGKDPFDGPGGRP